MVDVFISYSRQNKDVVRLLAERVQSLGYNVWWDRDLPPHKSYGDVISEKIGQARAAIVVWSENAAQSQWVRAEADTAREQQKLIQTSLDETRPPMPFNMLQVVSLADWQGEDDHFGWQKVRESLAELCPVLEDGEVVSATPQALPDTAPAAPAKPRNYTALIITLAAIAAVTVVAVTQNRSSPSGDDNEPVADAVEDAFPLEAAIDDPDGFVYVRNAPSGSAAVVGRVMEGESIFTREQNADWWEIRTGDGVSGFVQRSRIVLPGETPRHGDGTGNEDASLTPSAQQGLDDLRASQEHALDEISGAVDDIANQIENRDGDAE